MLVRSPGLLKEYYKNPAATAEVLGADGWYRTGDAGFLDAAGHLKIIDRAKDVGRIVGGANDGALFAPKYVENKLKFFPYIKEAVAFGDQREKVCAFVNIDMEAVGNWAERRNLPYAGYTDLAQKPEVLELVRDCVEKVNADLAADERLAGSQISRFLVLHKELDADDGELTRTRKVRRGFIAERYRVLVDALYGGKTEQYVETAGQVRGRPHGQDRGDAAHRRRADVRFGGQGCVMARAKAATSSSTSATSACASAASRRSPTSASTSASTRSARSSARTAPARARCSTASTASTSRRKARSACAAGPSSHMNPREVAEMGVARTFQNLALFKGMSVLDNIMTGRNLKMRTQPVPAGAPPRRRRARGNRASRVSSKRIIDFLEIQPYRKTPGRAACPTACRSASTSAARSRWSPRCCCSTSRWPA